jgi:membrane protease YdiL (CAAX protease family)
MAGKKDIGIFLVLWGFTGVYFLLQSLGSITSFMETVAYVAIGGIFIAVLATLKSDDNLYHNLNPLYLAFAVLVALGMIAIASMFSAFLKSPTLAVFSMSTILPLQSTTTTTTAITTSILTLPSSVFTSFLNDALFTCVLVATGEELMKLAGFAEIRTMKFYGATVAAVLVPVGLWAIYHGIQAYNNAWMIIPAFINGLLLIGLLWITKSFLAPIIAHGLYNTVTILIGYIQGSSGAGMPLFPKIWGTGDIFPVLLVIIWIFFLLIPIVKRDSPKDSSKYYYG